MEGKGHIYNDDQRKGQFPGLAVPARHTPDIFPFFPFSLCHYWLQLLQLARPLSAVSRHPHIQSWIVISSSPRQCSHKFPFRCLDQSRLTRDGQTSPITSSNPISDLQIPAPSSTSILLCLPLARLAFHLTSPHLSHSVFPALALCFMPMCHVLHTTHTRPIATTAVLSRALSVPRIRRTDSILVPPTRIRLDAHVNALRPPLSSSPALTSMAVSRPIRQLSASIHSQRIYSADVVRSLLARCAKNSALLAKYAVSAYRSSASQLYHLQATASSVSPR